MAATESQLESELHYLLASDTVHPYEMTHYMRESLTGCCQNWHQIYMITKSPKLRLCCVASRFVAENALGTDLK